MISTGGKGGLKSRLRRKESGANLEELTMMIMMTWWWLWWNWFGIMKISQYFRPGARLPTATSDGACKASTQVKKKYHHDHHHPIIMIDHHHLIIMIIIMIMIRILKILSRVRLPPHASPPPWGGKAVQGCHSPTDGWVSFHFTFLMVWNTSYFKLPIKSWYINDFLLG